MQKSGRATALPDPHTLQSLFHTIDAGVSPCTLFFSHVTVFKPSLSRVAHRDG